MITIEKNGTKKIVSNGAYEIYFKDLGYKKVNENKAKVEIKEEPKKEEKNKKVGDK